MFRHAQACHRLAGHSNMAVTQRFIDLRPAILNAFIDLVWIFQ